MQFGTVSLKRVSRNLLNHTWKEDLRENEMGCPNADVSSMVFAEQYESVTRTLLVKSLALKIACFVF